MKKFDAEKTIFLIDGSSFLYRAYYGLRPLHTADGTTVQAVYGFCRMIKKLLDTFAPHYIMVVWDSKGKTERHEIFAEYKSTRQDPPSDLFTQKELIVEFIETIGLPSLAQSGVEADDLMYSLAQDFSDQNMDTVFVTSDKDMGQAISDSICMFDPFKDQVLDTAAFEEKMGFAVSKLPFYFALLGDTSDNIPGVRGIGKKGATDLVLQFASLEDMYDNIESIAKERTKKLLLEQKKEAFLSRELFLLRYHTLNLKKDDTAFDQSQWNNAQTFFQKLNFKSLIKTVKQATIFDEKKEDLSKEKGYAFKLVTTTDQLSAVCAEIKKAGLVAIDTELDGLGPLDHNVVGISVCMQKGVSYYIPFGHTTGEGQLAKQDVCTALAPLFLDTKIGKVMHHAKFDLLALWHAGLPVKGLVFDTLIAAHLVTEDWQRIGLKYLSEHFLKERMHTFAEIVTNNGYKTFADVPLERATEYAAADAHQTLALVPILKELLQKKEMQSLYDTIEFPLVTILTAMEHEGIYCDAAVLKAMDEKVTEDLKTIRQKIDALVGEEFAAINLNSPKQLAELLFDHLGLPPIKKTTSKSAYSTDQEVLEELARLHPVPSLIVQHRELFKLKSTYLEALPTYINPETKRIHTTFSQTAVATGRLASNNPNLQNIPTTVARYKDLQVRAAFKPVDGNLFLSADYSQIELRVLAFLSQDENLKNAFLHGADIHRTTSAGLFDVDQELVTNEQRQIGKRINFSILYGLTPYGLAKDLKIPLKDARLYIEKFFAQYPSVQVWMDTTVESAKEHGYVETFWGRRRYVPGIYEKNKNLYDLARRIIINTRVQGTAAELVKKGMIAVEHKLDEHNLAAKMLLQIHDELLVTVPKQEQEQTEQIIQTTLESVADWNVPLVVTTRFGSSWQDVTK